jgi:hypothetical protein
MKLSPHVQAEVDRLVAAATGMSEPGAPIRITISLSVDGRRR